MLPILSYVFTIFLMVTSHFYSYFSTKMTLITLFLQELVYSFVQFIAYECFFLTAAWGGWLAMYNTCYFSWFLPTYKQLFKVVAAIKLELQLFLSLICYAQLSSVLSNSNWNYFCH